MIGANATHKKASQNTPGFVAGVAGWLAYYVLQYPFVARRASDVHWVRSRLCERRRGLGKGRATTTLTMRLVVEFPDAVAEVTSLGESDDDDDTPKRPAKPKRPPGGKRPELVRHPRSGLF